MRDVKSHTILSLGADNAEVVRVVVTLRGLPLLPAHTHKPCVQYPARLSAVLLRARRSILVA